MDRHILSYSATARMLGVNRATVADLMRAHGRTPKVVPNGPGPCKGTDRSDRRVIRRALKIRLRETVPAN